MQKFFFFFIFMLTYLFLASQQPTRQQMEQKQKEALEQLKKMGITIDPNKPMTKEEAEKLKEKLLKQAGTQSESVKKNTGINTNNGYSSKNIDISKPVLATTVVGIANRFYKRSYATLDAIDKSVFDREYQKAQKDSFSLLSIRRLADLGVENVAFGSNHHMAALFITAAVKANPTDTAAINNFGGYLRLIDSVKTSLPVLQYASALDSTSPIIATQFAATLFELGDDKKAEKILLKTIQLNPDHWGAHEGLCTIYFTRREIDKAMEEVFRSARAGGGGTSAALYGSIKAQQQMNAKNPNTKGSGNNHSDQLRDICKPAVYDVKDFDNRVKYPQFPAVQKFEDWTTGGGYMQAAMVYDVFHKNLMQFIERRKAVAMEPQPIKPGAYVRSYISERLMIYGIIDLFKGESKKNDNAYKKEVDKILKSMDEVVTAYTDKAATAQKAMESCMEQCGNNNTVCHLKCMQVYCRVTCPAAEACNNHLGVLFGHYIKAFAEYKEQQQQLLNDFYAFSQPWADKIESGYWSRQIEFDRKAFGLTVVGDAYLNFAIPFMAPITGCPDCSIIYKVFEEKPAQTSTKAPDSKPCDPSAKIGISLAICEVELDCESIEFGCTAGVSASVKRNFNKNNTTVFLGVGVEGKSELFKAGGKMGGTFTFDDNNNVVDFGYKSEVGFETKTGGKTGLGGTMESSYSFQQGFNFQTTAKLGLDAD